MYPSLYRSPLTGEMIPFPQWEAVWKLLDQSASRLRRMQTPIRRWVRPLTHDERLMFDMSGQAPIKSL